MKGTCCLSRLTLTLVIHHPWFRTHPTSFLFFLSPFAPATRIITSLLAQIITSSCLVYLVVYPVRTNYHLPGAASREAKEKGKKKKFFAWRSRGHHTQHGTAPFYQASHIISPVCGASLRAASSQTLCSSLHHLTSPHRRGDLGFILVSV